MAADLSLLAYVMNLFSVVTAFIAAFVLYNSNKRFLAGKFKEFANWVVVISFLFLFSLISQLYSLKDYYFGVSSDVIRIFNFLFSIVIGITFIMAAKKLYEFSLDFGFSNRKINLDISDDGEDETVAAPKRKKLRRRKKR